MPKSRIFEPKPNLDEDGVNEIDSALDELESIGWLISEADVATDNLAEVLRKHFFPKKYKAFAGITPSLYEVLDELDSRYDFSDEAVDASGKLKNRLEDSYRDEYNDDILEEIKELAATVVEELRKFVAKCPTE